MWKDQDIAGGGAGGIGRLVPRGERQPFARCCHLLAVTPSV